MTLILSAVSRDYAIQVSDRRLTRGPSGVVSDETNKAVLFCGRVAFAYTGLACMGREPMSDWLTRALVNAKTYSLSEALNSLAEQATVGFQNIRYSRKEKRQAFVAVGWTRLPHESFVSPIISSVSNAFDGNGGWIGEAKDEFSVTYSVGPGQPSFNVVSSGQIVSAQNLTQLRRQIRKCFERKTGPEPIVKHLMNEIHRVANSNSRVGKSLMVVCLPKQAVLSQAGDMMLTNLSPSASMTLKDVPSFYYVSGSGGDKISFAPNIACGEQGFKKVRLQRLNDSGRDASIEATIVLPQMGNE